MNSIGQRRAILAVGAGCGLGAIAAATRLLAHSSLSPELFRTVMLAFTLSCPVLLGGLIGVWGGAQAGAWGGRGAAAIYLGVIAWEWALEGMFPVGFRVERMSPPVVVLLLNTAIFIMTVYFMQALGRFGGTVWARWSGTPSALAGETPVRHGTTVAEFRSTRGIERGALS